MSSFHFKRCRSFLRTLSTLVADYIQTRRGHALLFSFEYNLLPKLLTDDYDYMDHTVAINELLCLKNVGAQISMFFTSNE